jgi:hypothetical protein
MYDVVEWPNTAPVEGAFIGSNPVIVWKCTIPISFYAAIVQRKNASLRTKRAGVRIPVVAQKANMNN